MISENCPKRGDVCISMTTSICSPSSVTIRQADLILSKEIEVQDTFLITPMRHVLQILKETTQSLERINHHPTDNSIIGIRTSLLESLQVVVARTESCQRRIDSRNVADDANIELDLAKSAASNMAPLVQEYSKKSLRAEDIVLPLQQHPNPALARKMFLTLAQTRSPIFADKELLAAANIDPPNGKIVIAGSTSQKIRGAISELNPGMQSMKILLTSFEPISTMFVQRDLGTRVIEIAVNDKSSQWLIAQHMSYGWEIDITATIDVSVESKALHYSGTLIGFVDTVGAVNRLREAIIIQTQDLFNFE